MRNRVGHCGCCDGSLGNEIKDTLNLKSMPSCKQLNCGTLQHYKNESIADRPIEHTICNNIHNKHTTFYGYKKVKGKIIHYNKYVCFFMTKCQCIKYDPYA